MLRKIILISILTLIPIIAMPLHATTVVNMIYWPGPESEAMQKVLDFWNNTEGKKLGIKVNMINFSREEFWTKQETILSSKSPEIDIAFVATYILGRFAPYLVPLKDVKITPRIFIKSTLESLSYSGMLYGIPMDVSNHFLYYRKDLISKLLTDSTWKTKYEELSKKYLGISLSPKSPDKWTWLDYKATAIFFTKKYNEFSPTQYGTVLQMKNLIYNIMIWNDTLWAYGGTWFNKEGKFNIATPEAVKAANLYKELYELGTTPPECIAYEYAEANMTFQTGKAAFMVQWSAAYHELIDKEKSPLIFDKVEIVPPPGPRHATHVHTLGLAVSKYSQNKEAAASFLKFLSTKEAMKMYAEAGGIPPVESVLNELAMTRPEFPKIAETVRKYGYVEFTGAETMAILQILANNLTAIWTGQVKVEDGLKNAQKQVEDLLRK